MGDCIHWLSLPSLLDPAYSHTPSDSSCLLAVLNLSIVADKWTQTERIPVSRPYSRKSIRRSAFQTPKKSKHDTYKSLDGPVPASKVSLHTVTASRKAVVKTRVSRGTRDEAPKRRRLSVKVELTEDEDDEMGEDGGAYSPGDGEAEGDEDTSISDDASSAAMKDEGGEAVSGARGKKASVKGSSATTNFRFRMMKKSTTSFGGRLADYLSKTSLTDLSCNSSLHRFSSIVIGHRSKTCASWPCLVTLDDGEVLLLHYDRNPSAAVRTPTRIDECWLLSEALLCFLEELQNGGGSMPAGVSFFPSVDPHKKVAVSQDGTACLKALSLEEKLRSPVAALASQSFEGFTIAAVAYSDIIILWAFPEVTHTDSTACMNSGLKQRKPLLIGILHLPLSSSLERDWSHIITSIQCIIFDTYRASRRAKLTILSGTSQGKVLSVSASLHMRKTAGRRSGSPTRAETPSVCVSSYDWLDLEARVCIPVEQILVSERIGIPDSLDHISPVLNETLERVNVVARAGSFLCSMTLSLADNQISHRTTVSVSPGLSLVGLMGANDETGPTIYAADSGTKILAATPNGWKHVPQWTSKATPLLQVAPLAVQKTDAGPSTTNMDAIPASQRFSSMKSRCIYFGNGGPLLVHSAHLLNLFVEFGVALAPSNVLNEVLTMGLVCCEDWSFWRSLRYALHGARARCVKLPDFVTRPDASISPTIVPISSITLPHIELALKEESNDGSLLSTMAQEWRAATKLVWHAEPFAEELGIAILLSLLYLQELTQQSIADVRPLARAFFTSLLASLTTHVCDATANLPDSARSTRSRGSHDERTAPQHPETIARSLKPARYLFFLRGILLPPSTTSPTEKHTVTLESVSPLRKLHGLVAHIYAQSLLRSGVLKANSSDAGSIVKLAKVTYDQIEDTEDVMQVLGLTSSEVSETQTLCRCCHLFWAESMCEKYAWFRRLSSENQRCPFCGNYTDEVV